MDPLWIGIAMMVAGLAMAWVGRSRRNANTMTVHGSLGTFVQGTQGDVNIGGAGANGGRTAKTSGEERFLKWGGFIILLAGLVIAAAKLFMG